VTAQGLGFAIAVDTASPLLTQLPRGVARIHPQWHRICPAGRRSLLPSRHSVDTSRRIRSGDDSLQAWSFARWLRHPRGAAGLRARDAITSIDGKDPQG